MKNCPKCLNSHNKNGKFCSRKCANSRLWNDADKIKKSNSAKNSSKVKEQGIKRRGISRTYESLEKFKENALKKLLATKFEELCFDSQRKIIILEQNGKCNHCKLSTWRDFPIVLEIDHIDGNHNNNVRENLEGICPNCHSLTPTWRGRNIKLKEKITDDEILIAYQENKNIRKTLLAVGMAAKGGNYKRVKKLIEKK